MQFQLPHYMKKEGVFVLLDVGKAVPQEIERMEKVSVIYDTKSFRTLFHGRPESVAARFEALRGAGLVNDLMMISSADWMMAELNAAFSAPNLMAMMHQKLCCSMKDVAGHAYELTYELSGGRLTRTDLPEQIYGEGARLYDVLVTQQATAYRNIKVRADSESQANEVALSVAVDEQCAGFELNEGNQVRYDDVDVTYTESLAEADEEELADAPR